MKITIVVVRGIEGLDELAEALGVGEWTGTNGFVLEGRSGKRYNLPALIQAHIKLMKSTT